jgi:uncharacterized protein
MPTLTRRELLRAGAAGLGLGIATAALGDVSATALEVSRSELALPNWDAGGFKVAVLADLHANNPEEANRAARACSLAIGEAPDAILIPGDFINQRDTGHFPNLRRALSPLRAARCPVIGTLGNHDYVFGQSDRVAEVVRQCGIQLLRNSLTEIQGVTIAGLEDAIEGHPDIGFLDRGFFSRSLICLLHEPDFVTVQPESVSIQISGHSHGGQICLPGGIPVHLPYGGRDFVAGFYPEAKVPLFVTRGVGTTGPQWRLFCRPEVNVLTLKAA